MPNVAVILSGCGVFDGAEICESVLTLLELEQQGASYEILAPDIPQAHVLNHLTGEEMPETRNVRIEAARIARGQVLDLAEAKAGDYDAVILPGGFGVAKNLSDFAFAGAECKVNSDLSRFVKGFHEAGKPIGLVCIAPALAPKLVAKGAKATIGHDADTAAAIEVMGGQHVDCDVRDCVVDEANKLVSTPAYMLAGSVSEAHAGIKKLVTEVLAMI